VPGEETVRTHLRTLYQKLGVRDRAGAVALALRERILD
jgi:DNA-binding CsgD family transcriptional regulator